MITYSALSRSPWLIILAIGLLSIQTVKAGDFASNGINGRGDDATNPIPLEDYLDLVKLSEDISSGSLKNMFFVITQDIDASASNDGGAGFTPIGNNWNEFVRGTVDGNGFTISNLYINRPTNEYVGLFGYASNSSLSNINIRDCHIIGKSKVAGLIGTAEDSQINNCSAKGDIQFTTSYAGVLVGLAQTVTIKNCHTAGKLSFDASSSGSGKNVGGVVGAADLSTIIQQCYSTADIFGKEAVGGIVGNLEDALLYNSYASGLVKASEEIAGGIVGLCEGSSITNCFSTGAVLSRKNIGGLIGRYVATSTNFSSTKSNYATGTVDSPTTTSSKGGIIGFMGAGSAQHSYLDITTTKATSTVGFTTNKPDLFNTLKILDDTDFTNSTSFTSFDWNDEASSDLNGDGVTDHNDHPWIKPSGMTKRPYLYYQDIVVSNKAIGTQDSVISYVTINKGSVIERGVRYTSSDIFADEQCSWIYLKNPSAPSSGEDFFDTNLPLFTSSDKILLQAYAIGSDSTFYYGDMINTEEAETSYEVTIAVDSIHQGEVAFDGKSASINKFSYLPGSNSDAITATASRGYEFSSWSNGLTDSPIVIYNIMTDTTITAYFIKSDFSDSVILVPGAIYGKVLAVDCSGLDEPWASYKWYKVGPPDQLIGTKQFYYAQTGLNGSYYVTAFNAKGDSATSEVVDYALPTSFSMSVFPNPALSNSTLNIKLSKVAPHDAYSIKIYNLYGQQVLEKNGLTSSNNISLNHNFKSGTYEIILLKQGEAIDRKRIIIK